MTNREHECGPEPDRVMDALDRLAAGAMAVGDPAADEETVRGEVLRLRREVAAWNALADGLEDEPEPDAKPADARTWAFAAGDEVQRLVAGRRVGPTMRVDRTVDSLEGPGSLAVCGWTTDGQVYHDVFRVADLVHALAVVEPRPRLEPLNPYREGAES